MAKIIIIGAGIAGLTAGVYAQMSGFETEIHEMHTIPGGECTAWNRGGYTFDNCIHWLMGSKPATELNGLWRETGALDDTVEIINHEEFSRLEMGGRAAVIYRELKRTEQHFLQLSPQDTDLIHRTFADVRALKRMSMPVKAPMDMLGPADMLPMAAKMLPIMGRIKKYSAITAAEFAGQFKDPLISQTLINLMPTQYSAMSLLMMLGSLDSGDSGYPAGGSLPFARRVEKKYLSLGGKVFYKSRVDSIIVENGRAVGVRLNGGAERRADWVISCADGYATLSRMLGDRYTNEQMQRLYSDPEAYPVYTTVQVSLGVAADLSARPNMLTVEAAVPVDAGGITHRFVGIKHYCRDRHMAPQGKSVVTAVLSADFDWWRVKKDDPAVYRAEKERLAREVCAVIEARYPETKGKIEQVDVVTPMTYARYCDAWRGAWMSWMVTPKSTVRYIPGDVPGLERFYMAGQWTLPPGGLPGAALSGRWVIQRICKIMKMKFAA